MERFSQKYGGRPAFKSGLSEASAELRTTTWNALYEGLTPSESNSWKLSQKIARAIWHHLHWATDTVPHDAYGIRTTLKRLWFSTEWPDFFDLFIFAVDILKPTYDEGKKQWYDDINWLLQEEGCAYRFVAGELVPLTNELEIDEVNRAAQSSIDPVAEHIREALKMLPPNRDHSARNSIKESISAVEAALKSLTEKPAAMLTTALPAFEQRYGALHPALRQGLEKLYAYTSDEKGIRHALVEETANVTIDDARFMVVACSAFANYLVALASSPSRPQSE